MKTRVTPLLAMLALGACGNEDVLEGTLSRSLDGQVVSITETEAAIDASIAGWAFIELDGCNMRVPFVREEGCIETYQELLRTQQCFGGTVVSASVIYIPKGATRGVTMRFDVEGADGLSSVVFRSGQ